MRLLILLPLLTGCGATPVFLGDAADGATFIARLTEFRGDTALPRVLHALGGSGVEAAGCQLSMRGEAPRGTVAVLHAGDCRADITDPTEFGLAVERGF